MKYFFIVTLLFFGCSQCWAQTPKTTFPIGEKATFKINYGWFTLGEASMTLADSLFPNRGDNFYHSYIEAKTVGPVSWFAGITNTYEGFVNTKNYKTSTSEKHIHDKEGRWDQWNSFHYEEDTLYTKVRIEREGKPFRERVIGLTENSYDLHGTYLFLRSNLWSGLEHGDSILIKTYWEQGLYDFGMEYGGTEYIKYEGKKLKTYKFYGLFPVSGTFPKEKAVTFWVMEKDGMSIPIKIEADMKIGKIKLDLKEYTISGKPVKVTN